MRRVAASGDPEADELMNVDKAKVIASGNLEADEPIKVDKAKVITLAGPARVIVVQEYSVYRVPVSAFAVSLC